MKNLILTFGLVCATLFASAQSFMAVTTYTAAEEGADWEMSSLLDAVGIGYAMNDTWTVGLVTAGTDTAGDANYDIWARYNLNGGFYASLQAPTEETVDNLSIGLGYSVAVWKGLCVEPNYTMNVSEDDAGERNGTFSLGLSYKF